MRFQWTKRAIEQLTWLTLEGVPSHEIAARLGCESHKARKMQIELQLVASLKKRRWSKEEDAIIASKYAHGRTSDLAAELGATTGQVWQRAKRLGLKKSVEVIAEMARERIARADHPSHRYRFGKGHAPVNKGLRRPGWHAGRMRETQFRKGERSGFAEKNWKPVGTVLADPEGFLRVKIRERLEGDPPGWTPLIWPLLHRQTWEQAHGPIPPGHKLVFKDGNRSNCALENLELLTDAELMRRNSVHNLPEALKQAIQLNGALKRRLRGLDA